MLVSAVRLASMARMFFPAAVYSKFLILNCPPTKTGCARRAYEEEVSADTGVFFAGQQPRVFVVRNETFQGYEGEARPVKRVPSKKSAVALARGLDSWLPEDRA